MIENQKLGSIYVQWNHCLRVLRVYWKSSELDLDPGHLVTWILAI